MPQAWSLTPGVDRGWVGCAASALPQAGRCRAPGLVPDMPPGDDAGRLGPTTHTLLTSCLRVTNHSLTVCVLCKCWHRALAARSSWSVKACRRQHAACCMRSCIGQRVCCLPVAANPMAVIFAKEMPLWGMAASSLVAGPPSSSPEESSAREAVSALVSASSSVRPPRKCRRDADGRGIACVPG